MSLTWVHGECDDAGASVAVVKLGREEHHGQFAARVGRVDAVLLRLDLIHKVAEVDASRTVRVRRHVDDAERTRFAWLESLYEEVCQQEVTQVVHRHRPVQSVLCYLTWSDVCCYMKDERKTYLHMI